ANAIRRKLRSATADWPGLRMMARQTAIQNNCKPRRQRPLVFLPSDLPVKIWLDEETSVARYRSVVIIRKAPSRTRLVYPPNHPANVSVEVRLLTASHLRCRSHAASKCRPISVSGLKVFISPSSAIAERMYLMTSRCGQIPVSRESSRRSSMIEVMLLRRRLSLEWVPYQPEEISCSRWRNPCVLALLSLVVIRKKASHMLSRSPRA